MPFSFFRPDGPPRGTGSNGSFSSFSSFSSYSTGYSRRPARSGAVSESRPPPPNQLTSKTTLPCDLENEPRPIVYLRSARTPPPELPFLPTPPGSDIRPFLNKQTQPTDESSFFYPAAKTKLVPSLRYLTPYNLQALRESRESPCILDVTPSEFAAWEARFPNVDESNNRYEYDGIMERMIIKCMAGPVHDSFPIYFFRAINDGLNQAGPQCRRGLQMCTSTG